MFQNLSPLPYSLHKEKVCLSLENKLRNASQFHHETIPLFHCLPKYYKL